jgi:hypothetical protein
MSNRIQTTQLSLRYKFLKKREEDVKRREKEVEEKERLIETRERELKMMYNIHRRIGTPPTPIVDKENVTPVGIYKNFKCV